MENQEIKELCLKLMKSDTEQEVVSILKEYGFWDKPEYWRWYGDKENNYKDAGNQAAEAESALVEKITNARDARLMNECILRGIHPEGENDPRTPKNLREAVGLFFDNSSSGETAGLIREWTDSKRTEIARGITVAMTGNKSPGDPCITIADCGEGQTPFQIPRTILSLGESIKMRIPFVHGKFNMGGTAVLRFCGYHNLQLVISKRNPKLLESNGKPNDSDWGFTIVRRNYPKGNFDSIIEGEDKRRSSIYTFLAPVGAEENPTKGEMLSFSSDTLPIFPKETDAYEKEAEWGTLLKLYEFKTKKRSHFLLKDGLKEVLDLLLPRIGLPIRLHECRDYRGHKGSFETTLTGLRVRLEDDKEKNLEWVPDSAEIDIDGDKFKVTIYAFKPDKGRVYRPADKAVIFTVNGQTQGWFSERFFTREKKVGLNYIRDSILVIVDCSNISFETNEKLFQNTRDRLSTEPIRYKLESELEDLLKRHPGLRALKEKRRREKKAEKLEDNKVFENVLKSVLRNSKALASYFSIGDRLSNPFKTEGVESKHQNFQGKRYPEFFKFTKLQYGELLKRNCHLQSKVRIAFETDAENKYFDRNIDPGQFALERILNDRMIPVNNIKLHLFHGIANLNLELPENATESSILRYKATVIDSTHIVNQHFINEFELTVLPPLNGNTSTSSKRRKNPDDKNKGDNRELPSGLNIPQPTEVFESSKEGAKTWSDFTPNFDKETALHIEYAGEDEVDYAGYDFYINLDNLYLNNEIKANPEEADVILEQFKIGMVLLGMAMLHKHKQEIDSNDTIKQEREEKAPIDERVADFTKSISPVLLPMINGLAELSFDE